MPYARIGECDLCHSLGGTTRGPGLHGRPERASRHTLRTFFEKESSTAAVRAAKPLGFDAALWRKVVDLGLAAIAVPEHLSGGGAGFVELAIAAECLGQTLAPVPLIEAAVANNLIASLSEG